MTPEERARDRYPQPTAFLPTADGWKTLNHRADGYAACIREVVEPLEARVKELEEALLQHIRDLATIPDGVSGATVVKSRAILNKKP